MNRSRAILGIAFLATLSLHAAPPPNYYDSATGKQDAELRAALHAIARNHHVIPYASSSFDTSDALKVLDANPADTNYVVEIYTGTNALASSFAAATGWNREHCWPNSYGLDDVEPAYSDLHNLRACDANVNSSRGNKYYDVTTTNGTGYAFPAHVEAPLCSTDFDSWEPPAFYKGDLARGLFYMAVRYTGDVAGEPQLRLTDNSALIQSTNAYMGKLATLLKWHFADPVDAAESNRNDLVYSLYQTNRNPFVDHPEWVAAAFIPPLNISLAGQSAIQLSWTNDMTPALVVEATTNTTSGWNVLTNAISQSNNSFFVSIPAQSGASFYRLKVP